MSRQFEQPDLVSMVRTALTVWSLAPQSLELEITETTAMRSVERSARILNELRALGVRVAIDDFGTGYSSLGQLKRLPLTRVKLDRSFVTDITNDATDFAVAKSIIALATCLSMDVLAEGIETDEQRDCLIESGCAGGQGWLFAKAMPPQELEAFLAAQHADSPPTPLQ